MTRPILSTTAAFAPATLDKVERLLEILDTFHGDPVLGPAFVLHGGTALNVFLDELPRLSVDIDLMYVGSADADGMRRERPLVDARLREITAKLGYTTRATNDEHSGQTYRLKYDNDYLKIDVSYLARVTLLPARSLTCDPADPPVSFAVLDPVELAAGKVKALMERVAVRDLYDLARLGERSPALFEDPLARALVVRAISSSDPFAQSTDLVETLDRFDDPPADVVEPLRSVLAADDEPELARLRGIVAQLLAPLSPPTPGEAEYLRQGYRVQRSPDAFAGRKLHLRFRSTGQAYGWWASASCSSASCSRCSTVVRRVMPGTSPSYPRRCADSLGSPG
jgi:hypothetical protein